MSILFKIKFQLDKTQIYTANIFKEAYEILLYFIRFLSPLEIKCDL